MTAKPCSRPIPSEAMPCAERRHRWPEHIPAMKSSMQFLVAHTACGKRSNSFKITIHPFRQILASLTMALHRKQDIDAANWKVGS